MKEIDRMVRRTMTMAVTAGAGGIGMGSTHKLGAGEGGVSGTLFPEVAFMDRETETGHCDATVLFC